MTGKSDWKAERATRRDGVEGIRVMNFEGKKLVKHST
jgi:hypothetical protein